MYTIEYREDSFDLHRIICRDPVLYYIFSSIINSCKYCIHKYNMHKYIYTWQQWNLSNIL